MNPYKAPVASVEPNAPCAATDRMRNALRRTIIDDVKLIAVGIGLGALACSALAASPIACGGIGLTAAGVALTTSFFQKS